MAFSLGSIFAGRTQQATTYRAQDTITEIIIKKISVMEMRQDDKTKLADFAIARYKNLVAHAWQNWQCGVVAVNVSENTIRFAINPATSLVKKVLGESKSVSHGIGATAEVIQMSNGHIAVAVDVPFSASVPSFAQLLQGGRLKRGGFLFGYAGGKPVTGQWQDVLNIIVTGLSQSGKTTTTRFLLAQAMINGAQFVIVDPHGRAGEKALTHSVSALPLIAPVAIDRNEWMRAIEYVNAIGAKRIAGDPDRTPVVLVIDEANSLFDDDEICKSLVLLLKEIVRAYSKVGVNCICIAHDWRASSTGGSAALRDLFQAKYVHRISKAGARLLLDKDHSTAIEKQKPGQAHIGFADGEVSRVIIPQTTSEDMKVFSSGIEAGGAGRKRHNKTLAWVDFVASRPVPVVPDVLGVSKSASDTFLGDSKNKWDGGTTGTGLNFRKLPDAQPTKDDEIYIRIVFEILGSKRRVAAALWGGVVSSDGYTPKTRRWIDEAIGENAE